MKENSKLNIIALPDGPVAFDGIEYRYSKGERLYFDNLAKNFHQVQIAAFVLRKGDPFYETCLHSTFSSGNISIKELPRPIVKKPGVIMKAIQFTHVFFRLIFLIRNADLGYLFLPSYPSAIAWIILRIWGKPHIVYGADDWVKASDSMFRWEGSRQSLFYRSYAFLNKVMEKKIVGTALFGVAAGGQLIKKYISFGCDTYPTIPRMTLSMQDIYEREDTCMGEYVEIVNVGGLIHDKAQHYLLQAFAFALQKHKNLRLKIIGEGPERKNLTALAKNLGISSKVSFVGYVESETTLYSYLQNSDMFVLSSVTEGFPRVLYEAMCMRLPIVTSNVGGIPHLLKHNKNALIMEAGDVQQLSHEICRIVQDQDLRKQLIKEGSKTLDSVFADIDPKQISNLLKAHSYPS